MERGPEGSRSLPARSSRTERACAHVCVVVRAVPVCTCVGGGGGLCPPASPPGTRASPGPSFSTCSLNCPGPQPSRENGTVGHGRPSLAFGTRNFSRCSGGGSGVASLAPGSGWGSVPRSRHPRGGLDLAFPGGQQPQPGVQSITPSSREPEEAPWNLRVSSGPPGPAGAAREPGGADSRCSGHTGPAPGQGPFPPRS